MANISGILHSWFLGHSAEVFKILVVALIAIVITLLIEFVFRKAIEPHAPSKRAKTLVSVLLNAIKAAIFAIALVTILAILQINITPILASAGIAGLAIGFGAQVLVKDIISGIFFIFENQFNAGDVVQIDTITGVVEHVGLRTIAVRDHNTGALHIIPNGSVTKLANLTSHWSRIAILIVVPVKNNIDTVVKLLEDTARELDNLPEIKDDLLEGTRVFALDNLDDAKMTIKVVIKTNPNKQEHAAQTFRYLAKKNFEKEKITLS